MDKLIVKEVAIDEESISGLVIPNTNEDRPKKGVVISSGPGMDGKPMTINEGDYILYGRRSGTELEVDGEKIIIMRELDVYAVIDKDDK